MAEANGVNAIRPLVSQVFVHVAQSCESPELICDYDAYVAHLASLAEHLFQVEPIGTVLKSHLEAWQTNAPNLVPFETGICQAFFIHLPPYFISALQPEGQNLFEFLHRMRGSAEARFAYEKQLPVTCKECNLPTHRGHCLVAKSREQFEHLRVKFALVPIFIWLDQLKRWEEQRLLDWIDSRFAAPLPNPNRVGVLQALRQAEDSLEELGFLMSGIVNDVQEVEACEDEDALDQFEDYVQESCCGLYEKLELGNHVDSIEAEHELICEEVVAMQRQVRVAQEKFRAEMEFESELQRLTQRRLEAEEELAASKQALQVSAQSLAKSKHEYAQRLAALDKRVEQAREWEQTKLALEAAKQQRDAAKQACEEAQQLSAAARLRPLRSGRLRFPCITCDKEASGVLRPCLHKICLECFRNAQDLSIDVGVPFLHVNCPICKRFLASIHFATFEFDCSNGREMDKTLM